MKFSELKIGDRFRYRNAGYTKTGPLQAVEDGSTSAQLIMRSAIVLISTDQQEPATGSDGDRLRQAIDAYHRECSAILASATVNPGSAQFNRLDELYQELLQILDTIDSPRYG